MQTTAVPTLSWSLHVLLPVEEHVSALFALVHLLHLFGHDGGHVGVVELKPALSLGRRGPGGGGTRPLSTRPGTKGLTHRVPILIPFTCK